MALVIPVSPLLVDPVPADGSPASPISVSSPLPEPEPAPAPLALPVPDSVPPFPVLDSIPEPLPAPLALPVPDSVPPFPVLGSIPEPLPVPLALPAPDLVPPLPVSVAESDWGSSASESHEGSLLISAYCQAHVLGKL